MKLGRKGFMLAEVVVVSVVIATVLVTLFAGLNNVSSAYEVRNTYYDVDSLYVAMEINDILIRNNIDSLITGKKIISLSTNNNLEQFMDFYESTGYDVSSTYFVPYNSEILNALKSEVKNQTFKDYINYLSGNIDFTEDYSYIIIVERENISDKNDCYYYALKLKY